MTFAVIERGDGPDKVVGTVWAQAESDAQSLARELRGVGGSHGNETDRLVVRRTEERELPMKLFN
jgi:hypothetical protein